METEVLEQPEAAAPDVPFAPGEGESFHAPAPLLAELRVVQRGELWRASMTATLPEATKDYTCPLALLSRGEVIEAVCEDLTAWCGEQKERGERKHRKQAVQLQEWALAVEKRERAKPATSAPSESAPLSDTDEATSDTYTEAQPQSLSNGSQGDGADTPPQPILRTSTIATAVSQPYPLNELWESDLNPRKYIPEKGIEEMAASMRAHGFRPWLPIVGRPRKEGGAEIAAGHRRRMGALRAGLTHVPAIIVEMSDAEFLEILNFDNSGREDVHALHEAAGWRDYMVATGEGVLDIATRIGKSIEYVYGRLKCTDLIEEGRKLFLDGGIQEGHAILIARQTPPSQRHAIKWCTPPAFDPEQRKSVRELRIWIKEHCHLSLSRATFSPADETLPRWQGTLMDSMSPVLGSCIDCPKRSGANPQLFSDIEDPNICTDPACYHNKVQAAKDREPKPAPPPPAAAAPEPPAPKPPKAVKPARDTEAEARQAEEDKKAREEREQERARLAREEEFVEKVYAKTVDAILEKVQWPLSQEDFVAIVAALAMERGCHNELADKFAIPQRGGPRWQDIVLALPRFAPQKIARIAIAGILIDEGEQAGRVGNKVLAAFAKRYKIDSKKIAAEVNADIDARLGLRTLNPPGTPAGYAASNESVDARKASIAKLGTLSESAEASTWKCGMCGHSSPARFRSKCQRCGAVKGMGLPTEESEPNPAPKKKAKPAPAKKSAKAAAKKSAKPKAKK